MIILKDHGDGTLLGADEEGNLFVGNRVDVGFDQLVVDVNITEDGYESVSSYGDTVIARGYVTKEGFIADRQEQADKQEAKGNGSATDLLDKWWATELDAVAQPHLKAFYDMPPGMDAIEKTYPFIDWTAR